MRKEWLIAAVIFGGLGGYALSPLPSFALQSPRDRIEQPAFHPLPAKPHQR